MSQQTSVVDLYEQSISHTRKVIAGVKPSDLTTPTPCEKWDVKTLMEHITGGFAIVVNTFSAGHFTAADHEVAKGGPTLESYDRGARRALELLRQPGAMERTVSTSMGPTPATQFLYILLNDNLIHGWDLAKATHQDTTLPPNLVEGTYAALSPLFPTLARGGGFKPPIPVPASASLQVKLLAGQGRQA